MADRAKAIMRWPRGIQLTLPEDFERDAPFKALLRLLHEEGFSELELNIADPQAADPTRLSDYLARHGFSLTRLATGLAARLQGLSLSTADQAVRRRSVAACAAMIRAAARFPAEVIVGFLKGVPEPDAAAAARFQDSLAELVALIGKSPVPVLLEVTNRSECPVLTIPEEAAAAIAPHPDFGFRPLLDTYHLHREGLAIPSVLAGIPDLRGSLHLSDDNRRLPGLGHIDFSPIFDALAARAYEGSVVLEGSFGPDPRADIRRSVRCLDSLGRI
jgi:sugar phosphate isomerase/epimerase